MGIGSFDLFRPEHADVFDFRSYCATGSNRVLMQAGVLDILPCHYSQLPALIYNGTLQVDVVLLRVSPPDAQGRYSLGLANDYLCAAIENARVIIGEVDSAVPWTYGEFFLAKTDFQLLIETDNEEESASPCLTDAGPSLVDTAIGAHVASLVEDGATLQVGIGRIPDAILASLKSHRNLGFHSGAATDGLVALAESGALTNAYKDIDTGISVAGMLIGSRKLHDFAHRNARFRLRAATYTHAPRVLGSIRRFAALNSALEVDLAGRVNTEYVNGKYVGTLGGGADFMRGALASEGGLPVVALASAVKARSTIVPLLSGPTALSAADAGIVVTEYGIADLRGQTLAERRRRMLAITHPDLREQLERQALSR